MTEHKEAGDI